ncbi:CRAL-TRIO domain-containing protein [Lentinula lateritia]|uniref:CRAL-TRIO domain-containing protein n=1 Tax=Lentinula aff. lateritia TaxID=2804960 RepID=A0ACC1UE80_9AGAR|nr:CRAL-TRIO domain-containing protein [Lentinula aff. lateritia]KAJ3849561.1 CRAL-TRIO domain-containing protein [Lentinula lateritia]
MSTSQSDLKSKVLSQFREELFSEGILHEGDTIGTDDGTLKQVVDSRFLRARKYNLSDAKKMFIDAQNWRQSVKLDELYDKIDPFDYPEREAVFDCWPMWFHKLGRPLNLQFLGGLDLQRLSKEGVTPERHWETIIVNAECLTREILPAAAKKYGKEIDSVLVIIDLKGFGLSKFWQMKHLAQKSFQISQDYYPETMGRLVILNAPSTFTIIWNAIRPWIAKETANKVDILGADYREQLLELVDEENLPWAVGGKCRCESEGGKSEGPRCHTSATGPWLEGRVGWGPNAKQREGKQSKPDSETAGSVPKPHSEDVEHDVDSSFLHGDSKLIEGLLTPIASGSSSPKDTAIEGGNAYTDEEEKQIA